MQQQKFLFMRKTCGFLTFWWKGLRLFNPIDIYFPTLSLLNVAYIGMLPDFSCALLFMPLFQGGWLLWTKLAGILKMDVYITAVNIGMMNILRLVFIDHGTCSFEILSLEQQNISSTESRGTLISTQVFGFLFTCFFKYVVSFQLVFSGSLNTHSSNI